MYISQNRLMWVFNEIQGQQRPLGGTNIDFSELLMQSFCIEERGTYKNNSEKSVAQALNDAWNFDWVPAVEPPATPVCF